MGLTSNTMRSVLFALAFAGLAAAQLSPHVGDAWESPATEYCWHSEDPAGHKCYEGCATRPFKNKGLAQPGVCNPHLFNKVTSTKNVVQCSDGVTNVKYCAAPLYTVTVTQKTLGENAVEVLAEASVASMFVHQIVTSPGDHCLEITIPGGAGSPFWKANSWKYSAPDRPEWKTGACDHTKWDEVDSTTDNYDGYTAAKNSPYAAVSLNKYGIKTATPAPTPIPDEVEAVSVAFDICDPTGVVHAFGTDGNDKGKCLEITFGGGKSQSHFWQKDGWKYSTNKVWSDGKCDRTTFPTVSSMTKDFGGWTAATNSDRVPSCGNVNFTKYNPKAVEVELEATAVTTSCTKDSDCPGNYCMDGPDKTPPYSCHDEPTPTPPTPPPPAPTDAPNCTQAGQDDLCKITCESTCRGFQPGFKAAGCADQKYCTNPPAWAKGSVCKCSSTPPAPPAPPT